MADVSIASLWGAQLRAITFTPGGEQPHVPPKNGPDANFLVDNPRRHVYNASQHGHERLPDRRERRHARTLPAPGMVATKESPFAHRHYTAGLGRLSRRLSARAHAATICDLDPSACLRGRCRKTQT